LAEGSWVRLSRCYPNYSEALLERLSIITQNSREEKHIGEVTWKSKAHVCYTITNNLIRKAMMLVPYNQLNQIELRNERKDLMARDVTTGSLTTV
jgi:hypothetical protein